jgi:hypothetical protein
MKLHGLKPKESVVLDEYQKDHAMIRGVYIDDGSIKFTEGI